MNFQDLSGRRTVLLAGGAGFLGSHFCEALLDRGDRVICVDSFLTGSRNNIISFTNHPRFRLVRHDICEVLEVEEPLDDVINLACAASPPRYQADPIHTMMTSVLGTRNLLDLAQRHDARFLQASTSEVYGDPEVHPQKETYLGHVNCTGPRACYDEGKRAAEALCFDYLRLGRVDARIVRIFNTYGPRMQADDGRIVSNLVNQALNGEALTIYGDGEQTRSFCYVSDLIEGMIRLLRISENPGHPVNLGNPREFTINELVKLVARYTERNVSIVHMPLPQDDPRMRRPDITRAVELLGWEPQVHLEQGLPQTINWFRQASEVA